jgi:ATP adenylyltransferase/5',5'''-P-1,P-4-tetraphosphate phosphorylase II
MSEKFMLVVPRKNEYVLEKFSVNALFFLGSFICKNLQDFQYLNEYYFEEIYQDAVFNN